MNERAILIGLRLTLGLMLLGLTAISVTVYLTARNDSVLIGGAIASVSTFWTGIYFCGAGLERELWMPLWTPKWPVEDETEEATK